MNLVQNNVCVCVCVCTRMRVQREKHTHTCLMGLELCGEGCQ